MGLLWWLWILASHDGRRFRAHRGHKYFAMVAFNGPGNASDFEPYVAELRKDGLVQPLTRYPGEPYRVILLFTASLEQDFAIGVPARLKGGRTMTWERIWETT